jgi:nucleotide-binding universal stress UspA family protein
VLFRSFAIGQAHVFGARLVGLAVVDEPQIRAGSAAGIGGSSFKHERDEALVADARRHAETWLADFAKHCDESGVPARTLELVGRADAAILREMESHDLTVIGRDANFHFETDDADSSTRDAILHRAKKPVILVPHEPKGNRKNVLIAYDGSSASKRAVAAFADSGIAAGRLLHVATVDDDGTTAWEMVNRAVTSLKERGLSATAHNVVSPLPIPEAMLELREKLDAGLMVMGAYAQSRLRELIWGSVTRDLIEKTPSLLFMHH